MTSTFNQLLKKYDENKRHCPIVRCEKKTPFCLGKYIRSRDGQTMCINCWKEVDRAGFEATRPIGLANTVLLATLPKENTHAYT